MQWLPTWTRHLILSGGLILLGWGAFYVYNTYRLRQTQARQKAEQFGERRALISHNRARDLTNVLNLLDQYRRARQSHDWRRAHELGNQLSRHHRLPPPGFRDVTAQWAEIERDTFQRARTWGKYLLERGRNVASSVEPN